MKTLLVILSLLLSCEAIGQPLVPVLQDSVPDAYYTMYHDSICAYLNPRSIWSTGDDPIIWFIKSDTSEMTSENTAKVRVWGEPSRGVEIEVCSGWDLYNLWVLTPVLENPMRTGYGAYEYTFSSPNKPATFITVSRHAWKHDGTRNGQGSALIDCVEAIPQATNGVSVSASIPSKAVRYYDMLGREVKPVHSGMYVGSNHTKLVIVR